MMNRIWRIYHPAVFQGAGRNKNYFEGWYFKCLDSSRSRGYAFIAGVSYAENPEDSHSFIQIIDGHRHLSEYIRFPLEAFKTGSRKFEALIRENYFSAESIKLNISSGKLAVRGELRFSNTIPWPVTLFSPGIMGPFAFLPFLECYHGVVSLNSGISGSLEINGETVNFDGGKGYIEKDYGKSMPIAWIWMQSNNFEDESVSLTFSYARVPLKAFSMDGFIVGFLLKGRLYRFTSYNGSRISVTRNDQPGVTAEIRNFRHILRIRAYKGDSAPLVSPVLGTMKGRIAESINSRIEVGLFRRGKPDAPLFSGTGLNAGFEAVGDMPQKAG